MGPLALGPLCWSAGGTATGTSWPRFREGNSGPRFVPHFVHLLVGPSWSRRLLQVSWSMEGLFCPYSQTHVLLSGSLDSSTTARKLGGTCRSHAEMSANSNPWLLMIHTNISMQRILPDVERAVTNLIQKQLTSSARSPSRSIQSRPIPEDTLKPEPSAHSFKWPTLPQNST